MHQLWVQAWSAVGLAPATVAIVGAVGNLFGGFVGPTLVGVLKGATGNFSLAVDLLALFAVLAGVRVVGFVRPPVHALAVDEAPAPPCPKGGPCGRPARFRERCLGRVRGDGDC